MHLEKGTWN